MRRNVPRARAILIRDDEVALIQRDRDGRRYYVFPGGGIETGETPQSAVVREVREELGLIVSVNALIASVAIQGDVHLFFTVQIVGGSFGSGDGEEITSPSSPGSGTYKPIWVPITELTSLLVYPSSMIDVIVDGFQGRWPPTPLFLSDSPYP
jgi:8-oxo-dGTP diphosphatase